MKRLLSGLCFILFIFSNILAYAYVVGEVSPFYPIKEKDLSLIIEEKIKKIDLEKIQKEMVETAKKKLAVYRLPNAVKDIPKAKQPKIYKVDLSYTLTYDIKDLYGNVLYPKGYKFNPVELLAKKGIFYPYILVVINGEDDKEVSWFKENFNEGDNVKLMITNGYAIKLSEKLNRPVYYLTNKIKEKFLIEETPSVIYQPKDSYYFVVQTFVCEE